MTRPIMGELLFTGINKDKVPGDIDPDWWSDGRNVMFIAGETRRVPGEARMIPASGIMAPDVRRIHYIDMGEQSWWIAVGDGGVSVTDGVSVFDITPVGWGPILAKNLIYSVGDINGVPFVNHPEKQAYWWNGLPASKMVVLPDWPAGWSAHVMRSHKYFLVAAAINTPAGLLENQVSWSSSADPGTIPSYWVPSPTNDAGDVTFAAPSGPIVDLLSVRDQLLVAKNNFTGVMQHVGGQFVFAARDVFPSTGLFAPDCWVEAGNLVYMFSGSGEFIRHDMTSVSNVLLGVMQDYVRKQINYQYPSSVFVYRDDPNGQVVLAYPVGTNRHCTEGITVELASGRPAIRDLPGVYDAAYGVTTITEQSWDTDSQAWDSDTTIWNESESGYQPAQIVFAAGTNQLLEQGKATTQVTPGTGVVRDMVAYVSRRGIDLDENDYRKTLSGMRVRMQGHDGDVIQWTFGAQDSSAVPIDAEPAIPFVIGQDSLMDVFIDGRMLSIEGKSVGGQPWQLSSMHPLAKRTGRW
jgi:hypothetical protein